MKNKIFTVTITSVFIMLFFSTTASANSSWIWLTDTPVTVLPYAIIFTLIFEGITIIKFGQITTYIKASFIIIIANLLSFIVPYIFLAYNFLPFTDSFSITESVSYGPYYIVLTGYLLLTLLMELPVVYFLLEKNTLNKKRLKFSIIISNIVTTLVIAIVERVICLGHW